MTSPCLDMNTLELSEVARIFLPSLNWCQRLSSFSYRVRSPLLASLETTIRFPTSWIGDMNTVWPVSCVEQWTVEHPGNLRLRLLSQQFQATYRHISTRFDSKDSGGASNVSLSMRLRHKLYSTPEGTVQSEAVWMARFLQRTVLH